MDSIKVGWVIVLVLSTTNLDLVQGLRKLSQVDQEMELQMQLNLINKPATKSFKTKDGDIFDCVEIDKQLAFDHPLLKNHSIQMEPSTAIQRIWRPSSRMNASQAIFDNIRCPKGTVVIKRVQKEDFLMAKFSKSFGMKFKNYTAFDQTPPGYQVATLVSPTKNVGIHGFLNVWKPEVAADQLSSSYTFVASIDGSTANGIAAGWSVNPHLYRDGMTRLLIYWTRDNGKSTGCFNLLCPGFVQISRKTPVGAVCNLWSTYGGLQCEFVLTIVQDDTTGNWWVQVGGENVGYYPKELFTTLAHGATSGGWGGEVYSPTIESYPPMGSGHFPEEGFGKACYARDLKLLDPSYSVVLPDKISLMKTETMPRCYRLLCQGNDTICTTMYFGGPPNCLWKH